MPGLERQIPGLGFLNNTPIYRGLSAVVNSRAIGGTLDAIGEGYHAQLVNGTVADELSYRFMGRPLAPAVGQPAQQSEFNFNRPSPPSRPVDRSSISVIGGGPSLPVSSSFSNGVSTMPAGNTYKVVCSFIAAGSGPWTEVYYVQASTAFAACQQTNNVMRARTPILYTLCYLRKIQAFNTTPIRDTANLVLNIQGTYVSLINNQPAVNGAAAIVSLPTVGSKSVLHWWGGLPAELVNINGNTGLPNPPAPLINAIRSFTNYANQNSLGSRTIVQNPKFTLTKVTYNSATGVSTVSYNIGTTQVAPILTNTSRVIIGLTSKKDLPGINGHWSITGFVNGAAGGTGSFDIRYIPPSSETPVPCSGYFKVEGYSAANPFIAFQGNLQSYGTHTRKNVFSNSRGAKHANRIRTLA